MIDSRGRAFAAVAATAVALFTVLAVVLDFSLNLPCILEFIAACLTGLLLFGLELAAFLCIQADSRITRAVGFGGLVRYSLAMVSAQVFVHYYPIAILLRLAPKKYVVPEDLMLAAGVEIANILVLATGFGIDSILAHGTGCLVFMFASICSIFLHTYVVVLLYRWYRAPSAPMESLDSSSLPPPHVLEQSDPEM